MKLFGKGKKEEAENPVVDEEGKVIEIKKIKKGTFKKVCKKVAVGVGCLAVGVLTVVAVGAAMSTSTGDGLNTSIDFNPDINPCASTNSDSNESSDEEKAEEGSTEEVV